MKFYSEKQLKEMLNDCKTIEDFNTKIEETATYDADVLDVVEGEVVVVSFPAEYNEAAVKLTKLLQSTYPENPVVAIVDDIDILIQYPDEALEMLDGMKTKIEILKGTKPSIVV